MIRKQQFAAMVDVVMSHSKADGTFLILYGGEEGLTRFTSNYIHQNVIIGSRNIIIFVLKNHRLASVKVNAVDPESLRGAVDAALEMADCQQTTVELQPILGPQHYLSAPCWDPQVAGASPEQRQELVSEIVAQTQQLQADAAGSCSDVAAAFGFANSAGLMAWHENTSTTLNLTMTKGERTGWTKRCSWSRSGCRPQAVIAAVRDQLGYPKLSATLEPGRYEVLLEPHAVADMLMTSLWSAFGAKQYEDGASSLSGKLGQRVTSSNITIADDPFTADFPDTPFDNEGFPRKRVTLIENGVLRDLLHDRTSAVRFNMQPNGHSQGIISPYGQYPTVLTIPPGASRREDMIARTKRGLLITRFHYNRMVDVKSAQITGVTRDGVLLIEDGAIIGALHNFRYNEKILEAMQRATEFGNEAYLAGEYFGVVAPMMRIADFNFSEAIPG